MLKRWLGTALVLPLLLSLLQACSGAVGAVSSKGTLTESTGNSALDKALQSGDARLADDTGSILSATLNNIENSRTLLSTDKAFLFNLNADGSAKSDGSSLTAIDWNPTHDAALLNPTFSRNIPVLLTNAISAGSASIENQPLGIIGKKNNSRYLALGSNPMRTWNAGADINDQMHSFLQNSLQWLTARNDLNDKTFHVVIAQMDQSYWFKDNEATRKWLDTYYAGQVSYNSQDSCDGDALAACITQKPDLLIISQKAADEDVDTIINAVKNAQKNGIPILYMHWDGGLTNLGKALLSEMDISYQQDNYWKKWSISAGNASQNFADLPANIASIQTFIERLKNDDFSFELSSCDDTCSNVPALQSEFKIPAGIISNMLGNFESQQRNIFTENGYALEKILVLLADRYRQEVVYPMDKSSTSRSAFLHSLYADYVVYNTRTLNPVQADMGNFSRSDFSHITPRNKNVNMQSKVSFRSAGVYALPGKTFTVTRTDNNPVATRVFINTLRSAATHEFEKNGYNRPKFLQTRRFEIKSGETLTLTSPYGGPIQIGFDANDIDVNFTFKNIGQHPYWHNSADNDAFEAALAQGDYDWAELATPGFEIHSKLDKMQSSMQGWGDAAELAAATMRYMNNFPHVLAGFQGPGIDVLPEIHDFAEAKGWQIDTIDMVKHMNADQATCGYGCSGNPYDAYWAYSPVSHGDLHELGHGLEKSRFRFDNWDGHASTNPYSYFSKTQYAKDTGNAPDCQSLPFEDLFNKLQTAKNSADPVAAIQAENLTDWDQGVAIYIQMMMAAQNQGALNDGWMLYARLHVMEREFNRAIKNETTWLEKRDNLGFSTYSFSEIKTISKHDWLVVAISNVAARDYRDYLKMWGLTFSSKASSQVAAAGYNAITRTFYASSGKGYCLGFTDKSPVTIDGSSVWPL